MSKKSKAEKKAKKARKAAGAVAKAGAARLFDVLDAEVIEDRPAGLPDVVSSEFSQDDEILLERSRGHWQLGEWEALTALADHPLERHPERAKLSLLAAVGFAQSGDMTQARRLARQAQSWGCARELLARVLIGGVYNSLGRAASLTMDDARAAGFFEASVATVSPRVDAKVLGRARDIHEKARLGQLPEAAKLMKAEFADLRQANGLSEDRDAILAAQLEIMNHELVLQQKRQLASAGSLESRASSQLGQDLWVLEQTGRKRGGFFVEFGATDGVMLSNTLLLESEFGWHGICAEPNPEYFAKLQRNRDCTLSDDCILGETGREVEFVLADEFGGVMDFADEDQHAERRRAFQREGRVMTLTSISLDDFLNKHGAPRDIDYLSIDTEGSEYDILSHFPWDKWNIRLITVEHNFTPDRDRIRALLSAQGYDVIEKQWDDWYFRPAPS